MLLGWLVALPIGLCAWLGVAEATVARRMTLAQMSAQSDLILRGTVVDQTSFWSPDKRYVVTHTTVRIGNKLKGRAPGGADTVVVRQIGGEVDGVRMEIAGNARLSKTEEVVLFLKTDTRYGYVQGMAQGKYTVFRGAGGVDMVRRDLTGLSFTNVIAPTPPQVAFTPGGWEPALTYSELLQQAGMAATGGTP
jgi:hypothetical protein